LIIPDLAQREGVARYLASPIDEAGAAAAEDWTACKSLIDDADVVSFDFFDTLVTRLAAEPDAVQQYVGHRLETGVHALENFFAHRKDAESRARIDRPDLEDVDLDMIYGKFTRDPPWSTAAAEMAQDLEAEIDQAFIVPRGSVADLLRYAKGANKRTLIVSDSYFPRKFLEFALEKLGWSDLVDEIYLSSERFARKDRGALWDVVVAQEDLPRRRIVHFGDNPHSDVAEARARGLKPVLLANPARLAVQRGLDHVVGEDWRADILLGPLFARIGADPFTGPSQPVLEDGYEFGYLVYGPIFLAFFAWLLANPALRQMRKLYFAGREGYFLQQLFDKLSGDFGPQGCPPTAYLPISRRAVIMASQALSFDPIGVIRSGNFFGRLEDFLSVRLGLALEPSNLFSQPIRLPSDADYVQRVLAILQPVIADRAHSELEAMRVYGRQVGLMDDGPIGLVDIGYSATIQTGLQAVFGRPITGFYMATSERARAVQPAGGLAFGCFQDALYGRMAGDDFMPKTVLLEALLTAPHGQLSHFRLEPSGAAVPVHRPGAKSQARFADLVPIFEGGLAYCRDSIKAIGLNHLDVLLPAQLRAFAALDAVLTGRIAVGEALRDALSLEDQFCGNGEIPGLKLR